MHAYGEVPDEVRAELVGPRESLLDQREREHVVARCRGERDREAQIRTPAGAEWCREHGPHAVVLDLAVLASSQWYDACTGWFGNELENHTCDVFRSRTGTVTAPPAGPTSSSTPKSAS